MKHEHFQKIDSTQKFLIDAHDKGDQVDLVTSFYQTNGRGRTDNKWDSYDNSLAMSLKIKPAKTVSLTPLEISVHVVEFFKDYELCLKWPNDILTLEKMKCGGILVNLINDTAFVGIGINLGSASIKDDDYKSKASFISNKEFSDDTKLELMKSLYSYICSNRLSDELIISKWNSMCAHIDNEVIIKDDTVHRGLFKKIGSFGEAYIESPNGTNRIFNGSLTIL